MENFKEKVVVITGGETGIGLGFAKSFAAEGAYVVIAGIQQDRLREAVEIIEASGGSAKSFVCDVTNYNEVTALADFAWQWKGRVEVIINNAGVMVPHAPVLTMPMEHIQHIFNVNLFGVINGSKVFGQRFIEQGIPAAIYNVGSENSLFHGTPLNGAYVATKHGVYAMTHSLYEELPDYIDVSLICPGFVFSELGPEENMKHGMPTNEFIATAMPQLKAGEFYVVSHAHNMQRIDERHALLEKAYAKYAPRYQGDVQYDVRSVVQPVLEEQIGVKLRELK
ncbi:SDR family oxidoreductase [Vibrio sp. JC009]|uniref:SDR family NAD(P)-dependent oxidoreductase n=1 Tax=Vibrio sp. JC009 TaxID=2912314 RepID=UPI0023AF7DE8|nr:SDR family oxidoreductase [Vibrio sp. JC009]WED20527.1 SDR family oxidoreductase [Vibrio sp. JC009]